MTSGDKIRSIAYDAATGKMWIGANGTFSGNPAAGSGELLTVPSAYRHQMYFVGAKDNASATTAGIANFGQDSSFAGNKTPQGNQDANSVGDFFYPVPSGFLALCTSNLDTTDVIPSENFNTVIYSGTGSDNRVLSGVGFTPDLGIFKRRNGSGPPQFFDTLRGASQQLRSDNTSVESTQSNKQKTFTSDGYTLGTDAQINGSGGTYVAWNWKAGGSASSNTNGTITSSVSANAAAGFSIVSYSGNGSAGATVGHGLASAPDLVIAKTLDNNGYNWPVYHSGLASTSHTLTLDLSSQSGVETNKFNGTAPSSTVVTLGNHGTNLNGTNNQILYCFHNVDGYSKVGSYTGNGSADGTFVHCGFRPAYVMVKDSTTGWNWWVYDNARDTYNQTIKGLRPNSSGAEYADATYTAVDFLSNGFKWRTNEAQVNASGDTFIFLAFAETPFKFSNAR